ncbi:MAG: hypothetical protein WCV73_01655 [Patescibacteria group bacterium]|jgi:hypothetical protein
MDSLYRQILKKAWYITKKFAYLWPLGIMAAFLGNGGEYQTLFNEIGRVKNQPETIYDWANNLNALLPILDLSMENIISTSLYWVWALIIICLFVWLIVSALGGLIKGIALANTDEKANFSTLLKMGAKKFAPLLGLNIVAKAIVYGILILILTPLMVATFVQGADMINWLIIMLSFLVFIPLTIIVSLVTKYASSYVMLNEERFYSAFLNGWRLFRANWLVSLEMALLLFAINLVIGLGFVLAALLIFSPFFFFGLAYTIDSPDLFPTLMYLSVTLVLILSLALGALLAVFQVSSWTLLYLRLTTGGKAYAKLVRWVAVLPEKFKKKTV